MQEQKKPNVHDSIPRTLPLLDFVNKLKLLEEKKPFKEYKILAIQHLLGSSIPLFSMLEKGGARPEDIHIVGKAYSSHPVVVHLLIKKGYQLSFKDVFAFSENKPYDLILENHILNSCRNMLKEMDTNKKCNKGLIIDDGGKAIKLIHEKYPELMNRFTCVEQTSRGARTLSSIRLMLPVINVARSQAKTELESPFIAKAMVDQFLESLNHYTKNGIFKLHNRKVLLLGYGFIGENVAQKLSEQKFDITVFDPEKKRLQKAASNSRLHVSADYSDELNSVSVIIGCSGTSVFPKEEFKKIRKGTLLVNMASTDIEFSAWNFRQKKNIIYQHILPSDSLYLKKFFPLPWRSLYRVQEDNTYFYIANGGFPIDFSGAVNPIPANEIQLTISLLLAAANQAVETTYKGLIELNSATQNKIVTEFFRITQ